MTSSGYEMVVSAEALRESLRYARAIAWKVKDPAVIIRPLANHAALDIYDGSTGLARVPIKGATGTPSPYPIKLPLRSLIAHLSALQGTCFLQAAGSSLLIEAMKPHPNGGSSRTIVSLETCIPSRRLHDIPTAPPETPDARLGASDVERLARIYARCYRYLWPTFDAAVGHGYIIVPWVLNDGWHVIASSDYTDEQTIAIPVTVMRVLSMGDGERPWGEMRMWNDPSRHKVTWFHIDGLVISSRNHDLFYPPRYGGAGLREDLTEAEPDAVAREVPTEFLLQALQAPSSPHIYLHLDDESISIATGSLTAKHPVDGRGRATCLVKASFLRMALRGEQTVEIRVLLRAVLPTVLIRGQELLWHTFDLSDGFYDLRDRSRSHSRRS